MLPLAREFGGHPEMRFIKSGSTNMRGRGAVAILFSLVCSQLVMTQDKGRPTSLSDARAAVEANLRTPEGKKYDEQMGTEFMQKHIGPLRQCKQSAGNDLRSFWMLLKLDKDGMAKEILLYPETKLGTCAREGLLKESFSSPPRSAYWISVYLNQGR